MTEAGGLGIGFIFTPAGFIIGFALYWVIHAIKNKFGNKAMEKQYEYFVSSTKYMDSPNCITFPIPESGVITRNPAVNKSDQLCDFQEAYIFRVEVGSDDYESAELVGEIDPKKFICDPHKQIWSLL